jgi:hypothetical protein
MTIKKPDQLETSLDKLASQIVIAVSGKDATTAEKLGAFKILSTYWLGRTKLEPKTIEHEEGESFDDIIKRIETEASGVGSGKH